MNRRNFCGGLFSVPLLSGNTVALPPGQSATERGWDVEGQQQRRSEIYALHQQSVGPLFDTDGHWIAKSTEPGGRERLWNCLSFLKETETRDKANAIIAATFAERSRFNEFSHFEFVTSVQLLVRDKGELTSASRDRLTGLVREALHRKSEIRFMGYNDNFPAMENEVATLGGQILNDADAAQRGLDGMHRLLALLERRGMLSEYTSSTYSPVTMLCYSDIAEYSRDPTARQLAIEIERRVWQDIAAHFHAPTNILAGPHSRAYQVDSVGHLHQVHMMLYQAFGKRLWMNPTRFMFPPIAKQVIHHDGDVPFMQVSNVWIASGTYHPTEQVVRLAFDKQLPVRISATSEFGCAAESIFIRNPEPGGPPTKTAEVFEYPAGDLVATTYMTEDYAVGSATAQFLDGNQTDTFFVNFRRSLKPNSLQDVSTIFCRYTVDNDGPGLPWTDPRTPGREITRSMLGESGRNRIVQKNNTVLACYQSKQQFTGTYKGLRLTVVVPTIYRSMKRIWFEEKEVTLPFRSQTTGTIAIEDEFFYALFRPLTLTNHGRNEAVRIEEREGYLSIQLINYEGPGRNFSRKELLNTLNGFVAEVGGVKDYGSFEQFRRKTAGGMLSDRVLANQRVARYSRKGVVLELSHSLTYDGLKYASIDEKMQPRPAFEIGGARS
jgi:hypothetical protein